VESPSKVLFLYSCVVGIKKKGPKIVSQRAVKFVIILQDAVLEA
jgi:hypothetical protein